jgi:hypothetical protein
MEAGIAQSVQRLAVGWTTEGSEFESRSSAQKNSSEAHSASDLMDTGAVSPVVKRPECEADHLPPSGAEIKKLWIYTSTPTRAMIAWRLIS